MKFPRAAVAILLLITAALVPAHATSLAEAGYGLSFSRTSLLGGSLSPAATSAVAPDVPSHVQPSVRDRLVGWLTKPDVAVLVLCVGVLLLFAECNLPGAVLPGALGLLLLLSGAYGLSLLPLRPAALLAGLVAIASLVLSLRAPMRGLPAVIGTAGLIYSLWTLSGGTPPRREFTPRWPSVPDSLWAYRHRFWGAWQREQSATKRSFGRALLGQLDRNGLSPSA